MSERDGLEEPDEAPPPKLEGLAGAFLPFVLSGLGFALGQMIVGAFGAAPRPRWRCTFWPTWGGKATCYRKPSPVWGAMKSGEMYEEL